MFFTSCSRSRFVAETIRTSARRVVPSPRRSNSLSCRNRRSWLCKVIPISPTSSRKRVPPSACSTRPAWSRTAPVKAPRACPNSSLLSNCSERAGQLTVTKGRSRRALAAWRACASTPFPVPLSPENRTVASELAARETMSIAVCIFWDRVSNTGSGVSFASCPSSSPSFRSVSRRDRTRSTVCRICAGV